MKRRVNGDRGGSRSRGFCAVLLAIVIVGVGAPAAIAGTASLDRVVDTSTWHHPSPDPTGISRIGSTNRFAIVDSEVEETALWEGSNIWVMGGSLHPVASWSTLEHTNEPADIAMPSPDLLYLTDDSSDRIIEIDTGPDRVFATADDRATGFYTDSFSGDPEGIAVGDGTLIVTDGDGQRVVRVGRGADGRFGTEDDVLHGFSTRPLGIHDPEGVAFLDGNLFLVSRVDDVIVQTTKDGVPVDRYDISSSGIDSPSGIAVKAVNGSLTAWVTDRAVDNNTRRTEDDGRIYVYSLVGRVPHPPPARAIGLDRLRDLFGSIAGGLRSITGWIARL